jgi:hypothetical protein
VQIEPAFFDAMREQQIDAVLERRDAVRNLREIILRPISFWPLKSNGA